MKFRHHSKTAFKEWQEKRKEYKKNLQHMIQHMIHCNRPNYEIQTA